MRYAPYKDTHQPYRAPEMAGPPVVHMPTDDDVTRQPGTMVALFLVVALVVGGALIVAGVYGPSRNFQEPATTVTSIEK
jgi:hypothetical protein